MISMIELGSRTEWLHERGKRIGGSEAAAIVGLNPFTSNVDLWELKTGRRKAEEITDNPFVAYGTEAERYLRELFRLDHPQYKVEYIENNLWTNDLYPFAHASLDGWMYDNDGRLGILEIKTATITSGAQKTKWDDRIPSNYYCQVLWYMAITDADFAILKAQLKWDSENVLCVTKHYHIERNDVQDDIDYLMEKGREFWSYIENDKRPPLVLPEI